MDIFYCDLCGVRVTDADLRAGHGARRRWDVICGACLEQGHGQAWLSERVGLQPAVAAAVAAAAPSSPPPSAAAAVLDAPRDRARTLEDDEDAEQPRGVAGRPVPSAAPVSARDESPVVDVAELVDAGIALDGDDLDDGAAVSTSAPTKPLAAVDEHVATQRAAPVPNDLASAAGSFARMGEPLASAALEPAMRDDLVDDLPNSAVTPTPAPAVSPFAFDAPEAEKAETARTEDTATPTRNPSGIRGRAPSGARGKPGSASSGRPASGKSGKSTSGRISKSGRRAAPDAGRRVLVWSGVSAAILLGLTIAVYYKKKPVGQPKHVEFKLQKELESHVAATREQAIAALRKPEVPALLLARDRLVEVAEEIQAFEPKAEKDAGWSEDDVGRYIEKTLHWQDLNALKKNINDELVKRQAH